MKTIYVIIFIFFIFLISKNEISHFTLENKNLLTDFMYITLIELDDSILFVGRLIEKIDEKTVINKNSKNETIRFYKLNKENYNLKEIDCYIDGISTKNIHSSITHNFTLTKIGENKYIANAGRDPWSDISHYERGHDKGMYFFEGYQDKDVFYFKQLRLGITKNTGLPQEHPASNECFTPIIKDNERYLIYSRYNIKKGERLIQIFESKDGINNWKLFSILNLFDINNNLLSDYSIYCINVSKFNNKYIALIRYSDKKYKANTYTKYYLYFCLSDDGFNFKFKKKICEGSFYPNYGSLINDEKLILFYIDRTKKDIYKLIINKEFEIDTNKKIFNIDDKII